MTTIDQTTAAQIAQPGQEEPREKILWIINKPRWMSNWGKKSEDTTSRPDTDRDSFYRRAIEWSHRADKVINLVLGYLLAVASVLGFMDVLSGGEVLGNVPYLFYVWLGVMGLGVEFQIFLVIGRMPDLARTVRNWFFRIVFFAFNLGFLAFLCYMSVVIAAVFTQHRDVSGSTIGAAMTALGIDPTRFVFERAALATLLLVLMAIDRTMERWRMQIDQAEAQHALLTPEAPATPVHVPEPLEPEEDKIEKLLKAMQTMNAQNLQAMQAANQQALRLTVEHITNVTIEAIQGSLATLPMAALQAPQISGPAQPSMQINEESAGNTDEIEIITIHEAHEEPGGSAKQQGYGDAIKALLALYPDMSSADIVAQVGCSERTARRWLSAVQQ